MAAMRTLMYPTGEIWFMFVVVVLLLFGIFVAVCIACARLRGTSDQTQMINEKLSRINDMLALKVASTLADSGQENQAQPAPEFKSREDQIAQNMDPTAQDKAKSPYERFTEKKEAQEKANESLQSPMDKRAERYRKKNAK